MLIFRYKKLMQIYARALEERGIPFEITGGGAFADSDEIREIVNLVKALNDPENPIYAVAVLRGNFFGCSDNELLNFKRGGGRFSFFKWGRSSFLGDEGDMGRFLISSGQSHRKPEHTAGVVAVDTGSAALCRTREDIRGIRHPQLSGVSRVGE